MAIPYTKEETMNDLWDASMSYVLAFVALMYTNSDVILQVGGLILLVVRLIADAPRAWATVKGWCGVQERSTRKRTRRTPR